MVVGVKDFVVDVPALKGVICFNGAVLGVAIFESPFSEVFSFATYRGGSL